MRVASRYFPGLSDRRRTALALLVLVGFSLLIKLFLLSYTVSYNQEAIWLRDSYYYHSLALAVMKHGLGTVLRLPGFLPIAQRPIGYPLILAGIYALAGIKPMAAILLQVLLSTGTVVLTWLLGRRVLGAPVAFAGALLLCFDPASISSSLMLMSETSFTFLLMAALALLVSGGSHSAIRTVYRRDTENAEEDSEFSRRALRLGGESILRNPHSAIRNLALAGLLLALAVHIRPVSYYLIPLLALVVFINRGRSCSAEGAGRKPGTVPVSGTVPEFSPRVSPRFSASRAAGSMLAFLLFPVLLVGGWQVAKYARSGQAGFNGLGGVNMLFYRGAGALALKQHRSLQDVQHELGFGPSPCRPYSSYFAAHPDAAGLNASALSVRWWNEGLAIVLRHPVETGVLFLRGAVQQLFDPSSLELGLFCGLDLFWSTGEVTRLADRKPGGLLRMVWQRYPADAVLMILCLLYLLGLYVGAAVSLLRLRARKIIGTVPDFPRQTGRGAALTLLVGAAFYLLLVSAGPEASARFRVPMMPILVLLAAAGWQGLDRVGHQGYTCSGAGPGRTDPAGRREENRQQNVV